MPNDIKIPELEQRKVKTIQDTKILISNLKTRKNDIPRQIREMEEVKQQVRQERDTKHIMEERVPQLYTKDLKKLNKELQTIDDAIKKKKSEETELNSKILKLGSDLPELEIKLYAGYQIKLSILYYKLYEKALKENTHDYDDIIYKINELRYKTPQRNYLKRIDRPNLGPVYGVKPTLVK